MVDNCQNGLAFLDIDLWDKSENCIVRLVGLQAELLGLVDIVRLP